MSGRPVQKRADIEAMQKLYNKVNNVLDPKPIIALTMRNCGCTFNEIGEVLGVTRQMAETVVKNARAAL